MGNILKYSCKVPKSSLSTTNWARRISSAAGYAGPSADALAAFVAAPTIPTSTPASPAIAPTSAMADPAAGVHR